MPAIERIGFFAEDSVLLRSVADMFTTIEACERSRLIDERRGEFLDGRFVLFCFHRRSAFSPTVRSEIPKLKMSRRETSDPSPRTVRQSSANDTEMLPPVCPESDQESAYSVRRSCR